MAVTCPTLAHILAEEECLENFAGVSSTVYIGVKSDLSAKLTATDNLFSTPAFKTGKGLYRYDCKEDSNKVEFSSLDRRKGFKQTVTIVLEAVNSVMSKTGRALNNLDIFIIIPDGDNYIIVYSDQRKIKFASDGIKGDTGAAASDAREVTLSATLEPCTYPLTYVTIPESGIDALLEGYTAGQ